MTSVPRSGLSEFLTTHASPAALARREERACKATKRRASTEQRRRESLGDLLAPVTPLPTDVRPLMEALREPEKRLIVQALQAFGWERNKTASALDINRTTLFKKMQKYGLLEFATQARTD